MADFSLKARSIFETVGGSRVTGAGVVFDEAAPRALISLAARRGRSKALSAAVKKTFGASLPAAGFFTEAKGVRIMFSGPDQWLISSAQDQLMARFAQTADEDGYLTDQSDAFVALELSGEGAPNVLSRLSSLDFADAAFPTGSVARTSMQQIGVMIARTGDEPGYLLNTPRSTARDFADSVRTAVSALSARAKHR